MRRYLSLISLALCLCNTHAATAGNIIANDTIVDGKTIQEVVVTGKEITVTTDKMIIRVNENVKKYSHDGYSALQLLMIPGLDVDPIDEIVNTHGKGTLLCINGREASKDEIKTLNPKDIRQIDYYQQFHPEYPLADGGVIDFIVRIRDNGGMAFAQANQNLNRLSGNDLVDWKFYHKKSEFDVQLYGSYNHYTPSYGKESLTLMRFSDSNIEKHTSTMPSASHSNEIRGLLSYIYRINGGTIKFAASLKNRHNAVDKNMLQQFSNTDIEDMAATDNSHTDNLTPTFKIQYRQKFNKKFILNASLSGDYTKTSHDREYSSKQSYISETQEKYYHLQPTVGVTWIACKRNTPFLKATYFYDKSTTDYWENNAYSPSKLVNGQAFIMVGNQFRFIPNKFHVTLQFEERVMTTDDGVNSSTERFFTPSLFYNIKLPHGNVFHGLVGFGAYTPQMKYFSPTEKRMDEYQMVIGNPNQKIDHSIETNLSFTSNHKWGMVDVFAVYENYKRPIYESVTCDNIRNVYVHTFLNGGTYERFLFNTVVQLNIIPKKLKWLGGAEYVYTKGHFAECRTNSAFYPISELTYIDKGFQGNLKFSGGRTVLARNGYQIKRPITFKVSLGYTVNNWFFNLDANNPFMKTPQKTIFMQDGFSDTVTNYSPRIDYNMIAMRVSYRFTYGKKHKFENVDIDDANRSAILDSDTK